MYGSMNVSCHEYSLPLEHPIRRFPRSINLHSSKSLHSQCFSCLQASMLRLYILRCPLLFSISKKQHHNLLSTLSSYWHWEQSFTEPSNSLSQPSGTAQPYRQLCLKLLGVILGLLSNILPLRVKASSRNKIRRNLLTRLQVTNLHHGRERPQRRKRSEGQISQKKRPIVRKFLFKASKHGWRRWIRNFTKTRQFLGPSNLR